jgi:Family of unknown function (DUF5985)
MNPFIWGASAMACWVIGLIFFRSWRLTDDRFFALFGAAFWILALHWAALGIVAAADETRHFFYAVRLLGFLLVLVAIVDKNRAT